MALALRDYEVFRGDANALPASMADVLDQLPSGPEILRVAKLGDQVIGCYAMYMPNATRDGASAPSFELAMVMVEPSLQRNGVGRWLVGHAIGVAESKGGRQLTTRLVLPTPFFEGLGFQRTAEGFRFDMYPE